MSLTVAGGGWHEDTGEKILQGRSEEQYTRLGGWEAWPYVGNGRQLCGPAALWVLE